jgi:hypothetical protein
MSGELLTIDFYGDTLEACQRDGKVWVSLRRLCENLGVELESQRRKLNAKSWATTGEITAVAEDGKQRAVTAIDLETIPLWLATIDERKVAPDVRPKLVRYQREAARVLADHFFRRPAPPGLTPTLTDSAGRLPGTYGHPFPILTATVYSLHERAYVAEQRAAAAERAAREAAGHAAYALDRLAAVEKTLTAMTAALTSGAGKAA